MKFYDINKLSKRDGILRFPISMSRISNAQDAASCFDYINNINPSKIATPKVGLNFCYSDYLYFYSDEPSRALKDKFSSLIINHKNAAKKLIQKNYGDNKNPQFFTESAFSFDVRNSLYLSFDGDMLQLLQRLIGIYKKDSLFQQYVREDLEFGGRTELSENQLMFFLEEHLIMYLLSKGQIKLRNDFVPNYEWILPCYPGPVLKHHAYILQQNFLKIENSDNRYEYCRYDLENKILYDVSKIDLEQYHYE